MTQNPINRTTPNPIEVLVPLELLQQAQSELCSMRCPSTGKTADGPLPHVPECIALSAIIAKEKP